MGINPEAQKQYKALVERCKVDKSVGREIAAMNKAKQLKKSCVTYPRVAYLCDTTTQVFGKLCPACVDGSGDGSGKCIFASKHTSVCEQDHVLRLFQRKLLLQCSCIIIECSFLGIGMSEEQADSEAIKRGHVSWTQLREHVEASPGSV